ncbi:hypothetical protein IMY05_018G0078100 [Salix suchowensis]|nr:hypothetical protein IMY05_018G0078100 [Salix suchowensis]
MNLLFSVAMNEDCSFQSAVISTLDFTWKLTLDKEGRGFTSGIVLTCLNRLKSFTLDNFYYYMMLDQVFLRGEDVYIQVK